MSDPVDRAHHRAAPVPFSIPSNSTLIVRSDQPIESAEIHTLDAPKRAALIASQILRRHLAHGTFAKLRAIQAARESRRQRSSGSGRAEPPACTQSLLLFSMAIFFGVEDDATDGLMIYATREEIAAAVQLKPKSTYESMRDLEQVGAIHRIKLGGPHRDFFQLVMPPATESEAAESREIVAQKARAMQEASRMRETDPLFLDEKARAMQEASRMRETNDKNARAMQEASRMRESDEKSDPRFQPENANDSCMARAFAGTPFALTAFTATAAAAGEDGGKQQSDKIAILAELEAIGLPAARVAHFAEDPAITIRVAIATRIETAKSRVQNKIGLAIKILSDPATELTPESLRAADAKLHPRTIEPAPENRAAEEDRAIDRRVDEAIAQMSDADLEQIKSQAMEMLATPESRQRLAGADARKSMAVRAMVRTMIEQGAAQ